MMMDTISNDHVVIIIIIIILRLITRAVSECMTEWNDGNKRCRLEHRILTMVALLTFVVVKSECIASFAWCCHRVSIG